MHAASANGSASQAGGEACAAESVERAESVEVTAPAAKNGSDCAAQSSTPIGSAATSGMYAYCWSSPTTQPMTSTLQVKPANIARNAARSAVRPSSTAASKNGPAQNASTPSS